MATSSTAIDSEVPAIVPAQVGFLAIFNPSLGNTDETLDDQIVYYSSVSSDGHKRRRQTTKRGAAAGRPTENLSQAERNERLRQIGLAQGMVSFGKNFSGDQSVDMIETEKTRVVLHEMEPGWWVLAVGPIKGSSAKPQRYIPRYPCTDYDTVVEHRPDATAAAATP